MAELTTFGYGVGNSFLHQMDIRFKLACVLLISVSAVNAPLSVLIGGCVGLGIIGWHLHMSLRSVVKDLRYMLMLLLVVFLARLWSTPGTPFFQWTVITMTIEGLYDGSAVCLRILMVAGIGLLFASTSKTSQIRAGVEWALSPIPFIPAKRIATMLSLIVRFTPMIFEQAKETADALRARCVENRKNPIRRMVRFGFPMIRRIFEQADQLALAMEARCYSDERTPYPFSSKPSDWIMLGIVMVGCVGCSLYSLF